MQTKQSDDKHSGGAGQLVRLYHVQQRLPASPGAFIHSMMSAAFSHGGGGPASFFESLNNAMPFPGIPANMPPGMHQAFLAGMLQAANAAGASPDGPESVAGTHEETDDDEGEGELVD